MNARHISPSDVDSAFRHLARGGSINLESGNIVFDGVNGVRVVVDPATEEIVSVHVPGGWESVLQACLASEEKAA